MIPTTILYTDSSYAASPSLSLSMPDGSVVDDFTDLFVQPSTYGDTWSPMPENNCNPFPPSLIEAPQSCMDGYGNFYSVKYLSLYSSSGYTASLPGGSISNYPTTTSFTQALQNCLCSSYFSYCFTFILYYLESESQWQCFQYADKPNFDMVFAFNVPSSDVSAAYLYSN